MRDLLLTQRMNRQFKAVIENSTPIQRALFFEPEDEPQPVEGSVPDPPRINPLLADYTNWRKIPLLQANGAYLIDFPQCEYRSLAQSPSLALRICQSSLSADDKKYTIYIVLKAMPPNFPDRATTIYPAKYINGSWRRMYLSQPPCEVDHRLQGSGHSWGGKSLGKVDNLFGQAEQ